VELDEMACIDRVGCCGEAGDANEFAAFWSSRKEVWRDVADSIRLLFAHEESLRVR
jgi:hypothetical protein